ncbi:UDP-N-acetylmuramyl pentapeptide phosphotransferase/UDP-N-acetylglucosamine-1-phosphate transferase (modular protein) [Microbacterium sp. C448]|uniref:hypothetical protein n=1 Tax=Microbacterium TaxID=33882 RepID=UPI0003DE32BB|nr:MULTISPECIES: hypothetical protein [Microbacterium]MDO8382370.1 hypothetical protein [Microbacterium sp.]CDJ99168.1 UDP-N-acetylmuramyl pentapeptide phosphotransferase/UDP-N-acetylglucosamine-1-phosphate transferase (modular protein) [Microbacterium sp. C448]|tara:strand:+ start:814 stop:1101 length:288 start_codon:yes stop_codon:yes gene_type:complete
MTAQGFTAVQGSPAAPNSTAVPGSAPGFASTAAHPQTGAQAVVADAIDPARRQDVLLRVRREEGHEVSAWWLVGAFVVISGTVVALMSLIPGGGS